MGKADYLAKYYSAEIHGSHGAEKRKRKGKRRRLQSQPSHLKVVDEDVGWPSHTTQSPVPFDGRDKGDDSDDGTSTSVKSKECYDWPWHSRQT